MEQSVSAQISVVVMYKIEVICNKQDSCNKFNNNFSHTYEYVFLIISDNEFT